MPLLCSRDGSTLVYGDKSKTTGMFVETPTKNCGYFGNHASYDSENSGNR